MVPSIATEVVKKIVKVVINTTGGLINICHQQRGQCFVLADVSSAATGDQAATCSSFLYDSDFLNYSKQKKERQWTQAATQQISNAGKKILP